MPRIDPLAREDLPDHEAGFALVEMLMGFVPNSMFTMARVPGLLNGFQAMASAVIGNDLVPADLKQMVAHVTSAATGCRYCQAHTGHTAERLGVSSAKLQALWSFETSDLFSDAERVALRLAFHAAQVPNQATDEHFAAMREHWTDDQITAIVAVISMFGYLNRWNDTMATTLEESPTRFGSDTLVDLGWAVGKHA